MNNKNQYKNLIIAIVVITLFFTISVLAADIRYNEVSFACTHNAMSNSEDDWSIPNQEFNISRQLNDGIRALMLDIHYDYYDSDKVVLQHGDGLLGYLGGHEPLITELEVIKDFLDANTNEIITIIFECYVDAIDVKDEFVNAGLISYLHEQAEGQPWPKLSEMISQNKRLVVLTDKNDAQANMEWYHYVWDYAWETDYSAATKEELIACGPGRGNTHNALFIFNHFLTGSTGASRSLADEVNYNSFFINRAKDWMSRAGQIPNFVTVDFYDRGDIFNVIQQLNSVSSPPDNVNASDGLSGNQILITWDACEQMVNYEIFRNTVNSSDGAARIATGISETQFMDTIVSSNIYYYWVKACKYGLITDYSSSDTGWCNDTSNTFSLSYVENFNEGIAHDTLLLGKAVVNSSSLRLTENINYQIGSMIIDKPAGGDGMYKRFSATFDLRIGGIPKCADGLSFSISTFANTNSFGEDGNGNGLTIRFDTYSGGGSSGKPAISVIKNGVVIANNLIDPYTDGRFLPVTVKLDNNGQLDVNFNGFIIFSGMETDLIPNENESFGFGARTGKYYEEHRIDNLSIVTLYGLEEQPFDVTKPGDVITGSSSNYPSDESPSYAIDNDRNTKYLNFDKENSGFTVEPSAGLTLIRGIILTTAGDTPERDPSSVTIRGSVDGSSFIDIVNNMSTVLPDSRLTQTAFYFANDRSFTRYQVLFPSLKNSGSANSMQISEVALIGEIINSDVTTPGDTISGSSSNYPESESPPNAIDNNYLTKYLNFDKGNSGFTVTPSIGPTIISTITLTTANDKPERDPASVTIRGSADGNNFVDIVVGLSTPLSDERGSTESFEFQNNNYYSSYQILFPTLKDSGLANSMQIAEVELLGDIPEPCHLFFIIYQLLFIARKYII